MLMDECPYCKKNDKLIWLPHITESDKQPDGTYKEIRTESLNMVVCTRCDKLLGTMHKDHFFLFHEMRRGKKEMSRMIEVERLFGTLKEFKLVRYQNA